MKQFFKMMFASMTGCLLSVVIIFLILFAVFAGIVSSTSSKKVEIKDKSVVVLELNKAITERTSENPIDNFNFGSMSSESNVGLNNILRALKYAATDEKVSGLLLDLSNVEAGYATVEAIRNQIKEFKASGKFVYAYADNLSQKGYFLATAANKLFLNPEGSIQFIGIYMQSVFFKNALAKLDVDMQIIRHGKFKSAIEPFILEKMSDENRLQMQTFADGIWSRVLAEVAESRNIEIAKINNVADSLLAFNANSALSHGMVDSLFYRDEMRSFISNQTNNSGKDNYISLNQYFKSVKQNLISVKKDQIAIIYAFGEIINGKSKYGVISGKDLSNTIKEAAQNSAVKAIVLRVNSPGGDALASDMIWREVYLANKIKPVVVSMGDYAASGGYYISCAARKIFAEPTTLTGSIGVFGVIPNMKKLFNDKLGITFDEVKTNKHSDFFGTTKPLDEFNRATIQKMIEDVYATFIKHVAEGRKMNPEEVDSIGQGRIWCGTDALRIGLVDDIGGIYKAIEYAAKEANVSEYSIIELPMKKDIFAAIMSDLNTDSELGVDKIIETELGDFAPLYAAWKNVTKTASIQTRLPYFLIVK